ncbi:MAG: hypothetical protein IJ730_07710 [Alphaproteobacteria bacterium]|nr:hypothetical protein [Alphaproteobacteria bacterium]
MRLFIWGNFIVKKLISSFCCIIFTILYFCYIGQDVHAVGTVANIRKKNCNNLQIKDTSQNDKEVGRFSIEILNETIRLSDKGLEFSVKINPTIDTIVKYNDENIEKTVDGERFFSVCIEKKQLSNHNFEKILTFSSENTNLNFDPVKLIIEPIVELKIKDNREVNFGKILWDKNGYIKSEMNPEVHFLYSVLKNTDCKIESVNGFRLCHKNNKDKYIRYNLEVQNFTVEDINNTEKKFELEALQKEFHVQFNINQNHPHLPFSGEWEDRVTFSIVCDK